MEKRICIGQSRTGKKYYIENELGLEIISARDQRSPTFPIIHDFPKFIDITEFPHSLRGI